MGGQVLLGPAGVKVETKRVVQHPKRDTDLVEIDADGGPRPFKITKNHLIAIVLSKLPFQSTLLLHGRFVLCVLLSYDGR